MKKLLKLLLGLVALLPISSYGQLPVGTRRNTPAVELNNTWTGTQTFNPLNNGVDILSGTRKTDTSPTGAFLNFKSLAGVSLFKVDINGNIITTGTISASNIPAGTINTGTGTTNRVPKFTNGGSGIIGDSGISDDGTTVDVATEKLNATGNSNQGTVALKNVSADHVIFASTAGNDANDGLSPGSAKLTSQAAIDAATVSGTAAGTVIFGSGNFSCPTTWRSNLTLIGMAQNAAFSVSGTIIGGGISGTVLACTSGSNVTLTQLINLAFVGITIEFNNAGGGFVLNSVATSKFTGVTISQAGSSTQDAVQLKTNCNTGPSCNTAFNVFTDFIVEVNTSSAGNCITFRGQGTPNAGAGVTDNTFQRFLCTGGIKNGIIFGLNSDTNRMYQVDLNNINGATGDALVFNDTTPASDQDADNEIVDGICFTGVFSHPLSIGASFGNHIRMCSGGGPVTPNILGGSPQYVLETTGLFGVMPGIETAFMKTDFSVLSGGGQKHQRVAGCTTAAGVNATCTVTLTWTVAFRDANYTPNCFATGTSGQGFVVATTVTASQIILFGVNNSAGVAYTVGTFNCTADHD